MGTRILAIAFILGCFAMAGGGASAATSQDMVDNISTTLAGAPVRLIITPPPVASKSAGQAKLAATQGASYPRPVPGWGGPKPPRHVQAEGVNDIRATFFEFRTEGPKTAAASLWCFTDTDGSLHCFLLGPGSDWMPIAPAY